MPALGLALILGVAVLPALAIAGAAAAMIHVVLGGEQRRRRQRRHGPPPTSLPATSCAGCSARTRPARRAGRQLGAVATALAHRVSASDDTRFIVGGSGDASVQLGAVAEGLTGIGGIGTAVALYPVLRRQEREPRAGLRRLAHRRDDADHGRHRRRARDRHAASGTSPAGRDRQPDAHLSGRSLVAVHDATFLLGRAFCAAIGNGLMLGYLLFRSGLVPRRYAQFGMVAGFLALLTAILVLFGAYDQVSTPAGILTLPEAV
jgi:hypothetical protein